MGLAMCGDGPMLWTIFRSTVDSLDDILFMSQEAKLKELVTRYSEFMNFPIYIQV